MNKELWIALLTFLATIITLATQTLPIPPETLPWFTFAVLVINAALTIFFGVGGIRIWQANRAAKAAAKAAK